MLVAGRGTGREPTARRIVVAVAGCLVAGLGWAVLYAAGRPVPTAVPCVLVPSALTLSAIVIWLAGDVPGLAPAGRRFWRRLSCGTALVAVGAAIATPAGLDPASARALRLAEVGAPLLVLGIVWALYALLRLPVRARSRGEWIRLGLDSLTVLFTTALFLWHLALRPMVERNHDVRVVLGLSLVGLTCLITLVAVLKVVMLGSGPVSGRSMGLLALTLLAGGMSSALSPIVAAQPRLVGFQEALTQLDALLVAFAALAQWGPAGAPRQQLRVRPYSKLPYFAVGATLGLLAVVAYNDHRDIPAVATGAIAVSAVVGLRQLVALRDNARLLASVRAHERRLRHQATHDALTGLVNRACFTELLGAALRGAGPVTVLLIDLDDFKLINDTLGHAVGDEVLTTVAARLRGAVRQEDAVARLGGDEFAALLLGVEGERAVCVAQRVRDVLTAAVSAAGHELLVRASVGVAASAPGDEVDTLLRNADLAMYAAKERGKGGHFVYVPGMTTRIVAHAELGARLREAIDAGELCLRYQPIVRLEDGYTLGTEALVRWRHPQLGTLPPTEFVPAAEQTGLIVPLGRWVLLEACAQQARWLRELGPAAPAYVGVNVSGRQLAEPDFVADVLAALENARLAPARLVIEVTETAVVDAAAIAALQALRDHGIRIALDDFGTAASSLGLLLTCPVTALKLDRSFVDEITTAGRQEAVATAVIRMAQALGLDAVAEGIETEAQAEMLRSLGYRFGQGYLYSPPLTPPAVAARAAAAAEPAGLAVQHTA
ncbi:putative bifunctional diguanylate cyclase/phosphodiesterase [Dactylosporangium sp. CA-092794]|uniref:putative bifunctional diguanylate cyclase/phosphodiesterase n=1 Tax=Dactylosporangium sp. CA-092794 TaxID=3239929 RepID=UPI003D8FD5D9